MALTFQRNTFWRNVSWKTDGTDKLRNIISKIVLRFLVLGLALSSHFAKQVGRRHKRHVS